MFELLGTNLYRYAYSSKGIENEFLRSIARQILISLCFLKKAGVIHCDLKPENIIFTDDKCDTVKLIDFGSSCFNYKKGFTYV